MREATRADLAKVTDLGARFHAMSGVKAPFHAPTFAAFASSLIDGDQGVILVTDGGMVGGMIAPPYTSPDWKMAVEVFWFADDGRGLALLRGFERWAEEKGADEVRMTTLSGLGAADMILRRKGYRRQETSYTRAV